MFDIILDGLLIGAIVGLLYCWLRGIDDDDCGWVLLGGFIAFGLIVALLLPQALFAKLHNFLLAIFLAILGYRILSRRPKDEYQKNDRWLGWMLIVMAVLIGLSGLCDVFC